MSSRATIDLWERVIQPSWHDLEANAARAILKLRFSKVELRKANALASRARQGKLSTAQADEVDRLIELNDFLGTMHSQARRALRKAGAKD